MKKLFLLFGLIILFSCEKDIEREPCWACFDSFNIEQPPVHIICDEDYAADLDSRGIYQDEWGQWHNWTCTDTYTKTN